jgi:group I intron endonuclease
MIGIYKIKNPKGKIYIGQSIDIEKRFNVYKLMHCINQPRLFRSFKKYSIDNHTFEIITECLIHELNNLERYYQDLYDACGIFGLNCKLTNSNDRFGGHSFETKQKISFSKIGDKNPMKKAEARFKASESQKNKYNNGYVNHFKGKKHSDDSIKKISESLKGKRVGENNSFFGKKHSEESILKMKNKRYSEETKQKMSISAKNKINKGFLNPSCRMVVDLQNGIIYNSATEALEYNKNYLKTSLSSFTRKLSGARKNNTKFQYI